MGGVVELIGTPKKTKFLSQDTSSKVARSGPAVDPPHQKLGVRLINGVTRCRWPDKKVQREALASIRREPCLIPC